MSEPRVSLELIEDFLAQKRIAMIGVSHDPKDFSVLLFTEFSRRGYEIFPVNPKFDEVAGRPCFPRVQHIHPAVDGAILMTSPAVTEAVVRDCKEAGVRRIWMYRAAGQGAVSEKAVEFCRAQGMQVIPGQCPFMFWQDAGFGHRLHGFVRKITGSYPKRFHGVAA